MDFIPECDAEPGRPRGRTADLACGFVGAFRSASGAYGPALRGRGNSGSRYGLATVTSKPT
jgi:hypothetical protein